MMVFKEGKMKTTQDVKIAFTLQFDKDTQLSNKEIKEIDSQLVSNLPESFCGKLDDDISYEICESPFDNINTFKANTTYELCYHIKYYITIYLDCIFYHVSNPNKCDSYPNEFEYKRGSIEYINKVRLANVLSNIYIIGKTIQIDSITTDINTDFNKEVVISEDLYNCEEEYS